MKKINIILCTLFSILFLSCEKREYYQGEYIIINETNEGIDCYAAGRNISAPSVTIHDYIPANSKLSLRKVNITNKATVKDIFVSIEIYQNAQKAIKNPMEQNLWIQTISDNQLTYTLVVDVSFFK